MTTGRRRGFLRTFRRDAGGATAVEFAFVMPVLIFILLNVFDLSMYVYRRMEVDLAAQMGGQAAWKTCDPALGQTPATAPVAAPKCPGLQAAVAAAVAATPLGAAVTVASLTEDYYCVNGAGALVIVGPVTAAKPANCAATAMPPGDYVALQVSYVSTPLFPGITITGWLTVGGLLVSPITQIALMRLE